MTCKKAQGYLAGHRVTAADTTDANRNRLGRDEALALARKAEKIVVAKGSKVVTFDIKKDEPDDDTLVAHLLGPTGNLRAPTVRVGKTLLVGFNPETYQQIFGK